MVCALKNSLLKPHPSVCGIPEALPCCAPLDGDRDRLRMSLTTWLPPCSCLGHVVPLHSCFQLNSSSALYMHADTHPYTHMNTLNRLFLSRTSTAVFFLSCLFFFSHEFLSFIFFFSGYLVTFSLYTVFVYPAQPPRLVQLLHVTVNKIDFKYTCTRTKYRKICSAKQGAQVSILVCK